MKLVSVETPEKSVCKMTFSATAEELETASNAVYERTRATYTIKGFQKGEADRAQIEADRGEHTFWYDAINDLMDQDVPALYEAALKEHGFAPVDDPSYDLVSVKKDEGFVATATVALQPELTLTKTTGFTSQCVTPEVTDKEIDTVLERRRNYAAELVPHKGPAVKGNVVHMDFEGLLDGVAFKGGTAKDQSVQLGSGRMIPGFEDGILGHKAGDEFEINVTFPQNYPNKELAGKPVVFKIKLHDVCVRQLPALNSDFAKKMGKETMEEYRAFVKQQLFDGRHGGALNHAKDMILGQLADAAEGEIPSILVENAYQQQMQVIQQQLLLDDLHLLLVGVFHQNAGDLALCGIRQLTKDHVLGVVQRTAVTAVEQLLLHEGAVLLHGLLAHLLGKIAVQGRQLTHAHVMQLDLEHDRLAGQLLVGVVLGEGDVDLELVPCLVAQNAVLETGDHAAAAQLHGLILCRAALKGHTVQKTLKVHVHHVALHSGALVGHQLCGIVAAALQHRVDLLVGHLRGDALGGKAGGLGQCQLGLQRHGGGSHKALVLLHAYQIVAGIIYRRKAVFL